MILYRSPYGPVALQREGESDVDGAAEDKVVELVQDVAERVLVDLRGKKITFCVTLGESSNLLWLISTCGWIKGERKAFSSD